MCWTPITLTNERELWTPNGYDGGVTKVVPCGKCGACLQRRSNHWSFRLAEEMKVSSSAGFFTLTYEVPPKINGKDTLRKKDLQDFFKRLRKDVGSGIKYFACGEYGTKYGRPHYHAIIFNLPLSYIYNPNILEKIWKSGNSVESVRGHIDNGTCTIGSIQYVCKYVSKSSSEEVDYKTGEIFEKEKECQLMSKKLGASYLTPQMKKFHKERLINYVTLDGGVKASLPRYYRDKIFNQEEKNLITLASMEARDLVLEELFNGSEIHKHEWTKSKILNNEKNVKLKRVLS